MNKKYKVPFNYLNYEFSNNKKIFSEWKKLIKSTEFTLGPYINRFENQFSKFIHSKYCISTNNGTDALILALKALEISKGDEVITVCNSFYATVGAIVAVGAKPIFVDCDARYQIDVNHIEKKINKKTKAIMPVHWGGASPNMSKISKLAKKYKLEIIEDACMGIGASVNGKSPGTFGKVNAFSMHPLKSLNVMGDGGMVATNNKNIFNWLKKYRNHGMVDRDNIDFWGVNMRMQPLQAIVAMNGLTKISKVVKQRNLNARKLDLALSKLNPNVIIPERIQGDTETFALYMIICKNRDKLKDYLMKQGVETKIHYPKPLHLQKASKIYNYKLGDFPISEKQSKELLTLPVHQYLTENQINLMISSIIRFYE